MPVGGVQLNIGDALSLFLDIPVGLTVADEVEFHEVGSFLELMLELLMISSRISI